MNKKIYILILILIILIFIIFNIYKTKNIILNDISIISLWKDLEKTQELKIEENEKITIDVFQTSKNTTINKKIAPGSFGKFTIKISKNREKEQEYKIKLRDITQKPQNLVFELEGKTYENITKMENELNKIFQKTNEVQIKWQWKYEKDAKSNEKDTEDGEKAQKYMFEIQAVVEEYD